jgi:hypothetical protein
MAINFIPNDPLAVDMVPMRQIKPRPDRTGAQAGFSLTDAAAEGAFPLGDPRFLFWQCREAALLAVDTWESLNGPLREWSSLAADKKRLKLLPNRGDTLNAFYDRQSLSFFEHTTNGHTTFSGASTDVVSHEAGHAFLDALRPDLFLSSVTEEGAFHEAFGDCIAILVALGDKESRTALLAASPTLDTPNFVEATSEDLSDGVKRSLGASHPAALPRRALNKFSFQLPTTLPTTGGPTVLTSEIHSFSRLFSGAFYDLIRRIFVDSAAQDSASLLAAATTAGRLLIAGAKQAPSGARFFQSVGRAMALADDDQNNGANRQAIAQAFAGHGVLLGTSSALMPKLGLAGTAPFARGAGGPNALAPSTLQDIRQRIGAAPGARIGVAPMALGQEHLVAAVHQREVDLGALTKSLKGVVAVASESVVVGASGAAAAAFTAMPDPVSTNEEVLKFVETLLAHDRIEMPPSRATSRPRASLTERKPREQGQQMTTHVIRTRGKKKVLTRVRFLCGCCV